MVYEPQRRASLKYIKRHVKHFTMAFYPKDKAIYEYLHTKESMNQYLLDLIAHDMEQQGIKQTS